MGKMFWGASEVRPACASVDAVEFYKDIFFMSDPQVFSIKGQRF